MYIIGTAGHIDHGKTSLIRALSGIDCDRLPEEKAREMTIDIGFAKIDYPKFGTVSIIDVPGHERFIRNMVVGAWGVDVGLLVVAVDDGWMPQTEDHFRVLSLLGIERIIAVLNKIDAADAETIELAEADVREHLTGTRFEGADVVRVSSKTGEGIAALKEIILQNIRKLPKAADSGKPYLFVDRVFTSKGYGTIVTGTLKNGAFHDDDAVTLLPAGTQTRVKKIESHNAELEEGNPSQRTALNLAGISPEEVERGHIVVKNNFFTAAKEIIARITIIDLKRALKNNLGIEIIAGTTSLKGKIILVDPEKAGEREQTVRVRFDGPWHFYPGEPFIITHPGGFRIIGGGTVLLPDVDLVRDKKRLREELASAGAGTPEELAALAVRVREQIPEAEILRVFPQSEKSVQKTVASLLEKRLVKKEGGMIIDAACHARSMKEIAAAIAASTGLNLAELAGKTGIDQELVRLLIPGVMKAEPIVEKDGRYFSGSAVTEETLPPDRKKALTSLAAAGREGLELTRIEDERQKAAVKDLIRLGFAVSLDGNIILHRDEYGALKKAVMALLDGRDRISIPEVRDATGLSRKYLIPLLNRVETDGLIKRIGDFRMKA
ncbi:MAG TPA: selenocysteine-specific translation elongation factor [Spirochaetota bacterium]|mgnify:CR=1 FL=1|nr:selenocysteine-specific translation elongation factor [Spirochaetota bacterium]